MRATVLACALALAACCAACSSTSSNDRAERAPQPLDPLDERELAQVLDVLRAEKKLESGVSIATLALDEPRKIVESGVARPDPARTALAVLHDRAANKTFEARVDLAGGRLSDWKEVANVEPMLMSGEVETATRLLRADERWQRALRERGIDDPQRVFLDVWSPGEPMPGDPEGVRILRALANFRGAQKNSYGPPIEGVIATVDMTHGVVANVMGVTDGSDAPLSRASTDFYDPRVRGPMRAAPASLALARPRETSIAADGHELRWQKWRMHWAMHPRDGLVLSEIGFEDGGRVRSILYRASVAEMWVPYGDPSAGWAWRNAFDEGEYGLGLMANTLVAGRNVPANALLFDAPSVNSAGEIATSAGVIAAYERDGGLLWSHTDDDAGTEVRRATELVVCSVSTLGNYDYGFKWIFRQDGTIAFEMDLTGIMLTKGVEATSCEVCASVPSAPSAPSSPSSPSASSAPSAPSAPSASDASSSPSSPSASGASGDELVRTPQRDEAHGTLVADRVVATNHQHFVSLRLDFDVDGPRNRVKELRVKPASDAPDNHGFVIEHAFLRSESEARRDVNLAEHRTWEVYNAESRNATGHAAGYAIVPEGNAVPYLGPKTRERALAGFVDHHLWVTRLHERELYAAGDYPSQGGPPGGLPLFASDDESIEDEDVVVWYTIGVTHVPRPEDYPVMPVEHAGVMFVPHGFFDRNPALDVP
jgi:primary-amine oxidase